MLLSCVLLGTVSQARGDTIPEASTFFVTATNSSSVITTFMPETVTAAPFTASSSGSVSGTDGTNLYTATGYSVVNANGSLGASSTISVSGSSPTFTLVSSIAIFTDELTVTAAGMPAGTPGTFTPSATITGSTAGPNFMYVIDNAYYGAAESVTGVETGSNASNNAIGTGSDCSPTAPDSGSVSCSLSFSLPITYGVPFELAQEFDAYVFATPGPGGATETGSSDFSDTAQITSIALDANGSPVTDFSITSASGLDYTANGVVSTPEPSSLALLGVGLLCLGFTAKRRLTANSI